MGCEYEVIYEDIEFGGKTISELIEQMENEGLSYYDIVQALKDSEL